jgi:phenylacetate-CoA ligase
MNQSLQQMKHRFQVDLMARLPERIARWRWPKKRIAAFQRQQLRHLLKHAIESSPFHASRLAAVDADGFELDQLQSLPMMTKTEMMENFDDVVTDRRLTLDGVQAHLAATTAYPRLLEENYFAFTSGGSSGVKGVFVYDRDAMLDYTLGLMPPEGPPEHNVVIAAVISPSPVHPSGLTSSLLDGAGLNQVIHLPVTLSIEEMVSHLNETQPEVVMGYPSILRQLAREQRAGRLAIRPALLRTVAEQLEAEVEAHLIEVFNAPILNTFACSEGLFGVKRPGEDAFTFATDLVIVELVDDQNQPVPAGTESPRVLLTNLFNRVQPLIRYALEDRLTPMPDGREHGHLVAQVKGKSAATFVYQDIHVNPRVVFAPVIESPKVVDYQIRQTPRGIDVDLIADGDPDLEALRATIRQRLEQAGLTRPEVSTRVVDALMRDPHTGKLRRLVPRDVEEHSGPSTLLR